MSQLNPEKRPPEFASAFMENESLGTLLMDFFEFYGMDFNWSESCIVAARGEIVTKESMGYVNPVFDEALSIDCLVNPGIIAVCLIFTL